MFGLRFQGLGIFTCTLLVVIFETPGVFLLYISHCYSFILQEEIDYMYFEVRKTAQV